MTTLVTGVAGFIGMHTARHLLEQGHSVLGVDSLNDLNTPQLQTDRLAQLRGFPRFRFEKLDTANHDSLVALFAASPIDAVVHLAAQAGVRRSIQHPHAFAQSNLLGFVNLLECCRHARVSHLVYASSSSVYGGNVKQPFAETDAVDHPVSLYAATKRANELMAYSYSYLYGLPTTGLRFFTAYGPWGRPDMAYFLFTKAILAGQPIDVFNHGDMRRDFTYIDDIVEGLVRVLAKPPPTPAGGKAPALVFNIGNHTPVNLLNFIALIERSLGKTAVKRFLPMQAGDVPATYADVSALTEWVGFKPATDLAVGVDRFVAWYRAYYKV